MGLSEGVGGRRALERKIEQQAGWQASSAAAHHLVDLGMAGEPFCAFMMMRAFIHRSLRLFSPTFSSCSSVSGWPNRARPPTDVIVYRFIHIQASHKDVLSLG